MTSMTRTRDDHLFGPGPKRILSLDGGGVRGLITLGVLKHVEDELRAQSPNPETFRLSDYFDLIGGTSTGALIATLLALGRSVDQITELYFRICPQVFGKASWLPGYWSKFDANRLDRIFKKTFQEVVREAGADPHEPAISTELLKTGLALVTKRIDTGAVWVLTNNPRHKFWDGSLAPWRGHWQARPEISFFPNKDYKLRKVAQASASAPFFLDAVQMDISEIETGLFLDGGASPYNNPAMELFVMAALKPRADVADAASADRVPAPHGFEWETGADSLYMLSIGTGSWRERIDVGEYRSKSAIGKAFHALRGIISDAETQTTTFMQAISDTPSASYINLNLEDLSGLTIVPEPLLTFRRVAPRLEAGWLKETLGEDVKVSPRELSLLRQMDCPKRSNLECCHAIGLATGCRLLTPQDFPHQFRVG